MAEAAVNPEIVVGIVGRRRTGKSVLLANICKLFNVTTPEDGSRVELNDYMHAGAAGAAVRLLAQEVAVSEKSLRSEKVLRSTLPPLDIAVLVLPDSTIGAQEQTMFCALGAHTGGRVIVARTRSDLLFGPGTHREALLAEHTALIVDGINYANPLMPATPEDICFVSSVSEEEAQPAADHEQPEVRFRARTPNCVLTTIA
jgi:hypothetical protein